MYPILLEFGIITVFSLWFFITIGFITGSLLFIHLAKRYRIKLTLVTQHSFFLFLVTLLTARLFFVFLHPDIYFYRFGTQNILMMLKIWDKGLSFWGAITGWTLGFKYLSVQKKESREILSRLWDILTPPLLLGIFFGNIGAFFDGINYGTPTSLPWGMVFRSANVKYISAIHPTQLYSAFFSLLIMIALLILLKKLRGRLPGLVTELGIFSFSFLTFVEEFFRGDETIKIFSIRMGHLLAMAGVILALWFLWERYRNRHGKDPHHELRNFFAGMFTRKHQIQNDQAVDQKMNLFPKKTSHSDRRALP